MAGALSKALYSPYQPPLTLAEVRHNSLYCFLLDIVTLLKTRIHDYASGSIIHVYATFRGTLTTMIIRSFKSEVKNHRRIIFLQGLYSLWEPVPEHQLHRTFKDTVLRPAC